MSETHARPLPSHLLADKLHFAPLYFYEISHFQLHDQLQTVKGSLMNSTHANRQRRRDPQLMYKGETLPT